MIRKALNKTWQVLMQALQQGTSPRKLALTCALGMVIGIFPVYGSTTLLCFAFALLFRLNVVVIQAVNYLLTPVQLILLIPFMQGGIWLFGWPPIVLELDVLIARFQSDFWGLLAEIGNLVGGGIVLWLLIALPLLLALFFAFYGSILFWQSRFRSREGVDVVQR
jgi:uncharacterized protein (DUF2062 family)